MGRKELIILLMEEMYDKDVSLVSPLLFNLYLNEIPSLLKACNFIEQIILPNGSPLRAHDCKYRESLARLKKSKILIICQKNSFGELSSKNIFNFQESIVFEKMRKNENSGFCLINYAKIRVKMTYFIASVPWQDSKI